MQDGAAELMACGCWYATGKCSAGLELDLDHVDKIGAGPARVLQLGFPIGFCQAGAKAHIGRRRNAFFLQ
jgi:hypothetical protein